MVRVGISLPALMQLMGHADILISRPPIWSTTFSNSALPDSLPRCGGEAACHRKPSFLGVAAPGRATDGATPRLAESTTGDRVWQSESHHRRGHSHSISRLFSATRTMGRDGAWRALFAIPVDK
jgi:hypothetical protein